MRTDRPMTENPTELKSGEHRHSPRASPSLLSLSSAEIALREPAPQIKFIFLTPKHFLCLPYCSQIISKKVLSACVPRQRSAYSSGYHPPQSTSRCSPPSTVQYPLHSPSQPLRARRCQRARMNGGGLAASRALSCRRMEAHCPFRIDVRTVPRQSRIYFVCSISRVTTNK